MQRCIDFVAFVNQKLIDFIFVYFFLCHYSFNGYSFGLFESCLRYLYLFVIINKINEVSPTTKNVSSMASGLLLGEGLGHTFS